MCVFSILMYTTMSFKTGQFGSEWQLESKTDAERLIFEDLEITLLAQIRKIWENL